MEETLSNGDYIKAVGLGILYMVIALMVQAIIQQIPEYIYLAMHGFNPIPFTSSYQKLELDYPLEFAIYVGFIAGLMQELATYIAVDTRTRKLAFFIGLGFAVVDIALLLVENIPIYNRLTSFASILIALNIISSVLFHPGTATFMKWGLLSGAGKVTLLISIVLHTILDGGVEYADLLIMQHPVEYHTLSSIFWAVAMTISVSIFMIGIRLIGRVEENRQIEPPVVF